VKSVSVHDAVGMVLCHDVTRIVPGRHKGPAFKKGHIIAPQDIEPLLDMGKASVYVYDLAEGFIHEDDGSHADQFRHRRCFRDAALRSPR